MSDLRETALALFARACQAADPARALRAALAASPLPKPDPGGRYRVVAFGKAAIPMAACLIDQIGTVPVLVVTNAENARDLPGATVLTAGHPMPDESGAFAAQQVMAFVGAASPADRVIALVSGGGSAMLPAPVDGMTLADKAALNRVLLGAGFDITDINLIRQQVSRLKGGGLLRATAAPVTAYILSDVIGDDLRVIASGPTVAPIGTRAEARALLQTRGLWDAIPQAVRNVLDRQPPTLSPLPTATNILIGSNRKSLDAIAAAHSGATIVDDHLTGDVANAAMRIVTAAQSAPASPTCLIFGGETTVTLRGNGLGGRNQELALRVAILMDMARPWAFLSGGTDGRDGPTDAAGGLVDNGTIARMMTGGVPETLLANNDSYAALQLSGDLVVTGATGTNVADVQIMLLG